jgi:hypothetical protein
MPKQPGGGVNLEEPVLLLGATGFAPAQREAIQGLLARLPEAGPGWSLVPFAEADAWWVNGSRLQLQAGGNLRVAAGQPTEHALHLNLAEIDRPIAFSAPVTLPDFEPRCVFDLAMESSVHAALHQFHEWLGGLRAQFTLGAMIVQRGASLRGTIQHLHHQGQLLAVLDYRNGHAGILPGARTSDLWQAQWDQQPPSAAGLPAQLHACTPAQLVWAYVRRTRRDMLPARYRTDTVYFRHVPRVPLRLMRDSLLSVVRELNVAPGSFDELRQRTGFAEAVLARDLGCMYYAGAITTTAAKAAPLAGGGREGEASVPSIAGPADAALMPASPDLTVPALLDHKPPRRAGN